MRIFFAGTPDIGIPSLEILAENFNVCGVLTNPDKPQGRKKKLVPSPINQKALELNLNIFQPEKLNSEFYNEIRSLKPDILVCIAFGKIFREEFLNIFPLGGINIHPSLLPKYRGPSPINEAILNGDRESGITIQRLANKMDSGNILLQEKFTIEDGENTGQLIQRVALMAAPQILKVIRDFKNNSVTEYEQDHSIATFCKLIKKEDGLIDWSNKSKKILNMVRGYNPWPYGQTKFIDKSLNIIEANKAECISEAEPGTVLEYSKKNGFLIKTGDGAINVTKLQLQSKKILDYKSFNNGVQGFVGSQLG